MSHQISRFPVPKLEEMPDDVRERITKVQEKAGGIAHALALAETFAAGEPVCVLLGDNIFEYSIAPYVANFTEHPSGARVLLKEVGDPERYGVAALDEQQVIEIEEKPTSPKSQFAVVGEQAATRHACARFAVALLHW